MILTGRPSSRVVVVCGSLLFLVLALHLSSIRECDAAPSTTKAPPKAAASTTTSKPAKPAATSLAPKKKTDGSKAPSSKPTKAAAKVTTKQPDKKSKGPSTTKAAPKPSKKPLGPLSPGNKMFPRGRRAQARLYRLLMESAMINLIAEKVVGVNIQREVGEIVCVQGPNGILLNQRLKFYRGRGKFCHKGICTKDSKSKCGKDSGVKSTTGKPAGAKSDPKKGPSPAGKSTPKPASGAKSTPKAADKKGSGGKSTAKPAPAGKSTPKAAPAGKSTPKAAPAGKSTTAKGKGSRADISEIVSSIDGDDD